MAKNIAVNDIIQANIDARLNGQQVLLTTHWKVLEIDPGTPPTMLSFMTDFDGAFQDDGKPFQTYANATSTGLLFEQVIYQIISPQRYISLGFAPQLPHGQVASAALPQNVSCALTLKTEVAARNERCTKHIGGVPTIGVVNGMVTEDQQVLLGLLGTALTTNITLTSGGLSITLTPRIYRRSNPAASPIPTINQVGLTSRVERRRTVGLGS